MQKGSYQLRNTGSGEREMKEWREQKTDRTYRKAAVDDDIMSRRHHTRMNM